MPLFQYEDRDGTTQTFTGPMAQERGAEAVFLDALGCSYHEAIILLSNHRFSYDGHECVLGLTMTIKQIAAVTGQAELNQLAGVMRQITQKYGFKECPECSAIHSKHVRRCRRCGNEAEIPDEVKKKMAAYYLDEDEPGQEQVVQEPEQPAEASAEQEKSTSPLHMMAMDEDEDENDDEEKEKETTSTEEEEKKLDAG